MKPYVISFKTYDQNTVKVMEWHGLEPYISRWTNRLCATVRVEEKDRERLIRELGARGYFPEWAEVFENQTA